jgi:hypothetical protein
MEKATVDNLPFIGQIVKVIMRDGREFNIKVCQELADNDAMFSIMFQQVTRSGFHGIINKPPPPPPPKTNSGSSSSSSSTPAASSRTISAPTLVSSTSTTITNALPTKPKKIDKSKAGGSITDSNQPFKIN